MFQVTKGKLMAMLSFIVVLASLCVVVNASNIGAKIQTGSGSSTSASSNASSSETAPSSSSISSEEESSSSEVSSEPESSSAASSSQAEQPHVSQWELRQAEISKLDPFTFKTEAARNMEFHDFQYADILRNVNQYVGQKMTFHGVVEGLKRDQVTSTGFLVCKTSDLTGTFVIAFSYDGFPRFIEGDSIYLYGVLTGSTQYNDDKGQTHETISLDTYFYDSAAGSENQPLTAQEQKYYYGNYMIYEEGKLRPFHIDATTINGHPYQACDVYKTPDSIFIQLEFTEWPDAHKGRVLNGFNDNDLDMVTLNLSGSISTNIHVPNNADVNCSGIGWNTKFEKPIQVTRLEQAN